MDGGVDEVVVGGEGDEASDVVRSNTACATTVRQTLVPLSKNRYKKLGIAKSVLDYFI